MIKHHLRMIGKEIKRIREVQTPEGKTISFWIDFTDGSSLKIKDNYLSTSDKAFGFSTIMEEAV